jgi:hypothetical protein
VTFDLDREHEVGPPFVAMSSDGELTYATRRHYAWRDRLAGLPCQHNGIIANGKVDYGVCEDCLEDFLDFAREYGLNIDHALEFTTDDA